MYICAEIEICDPTNLLFTSLYVCHSMQLNMKNSYCFEVYFVQKSVTIFSSCAGSS